MSELKKNILLVEDEVLLAMNEKMQLEQYGYAVRTVTTGDKAVEAVQTSSDIDLILMDINLGNGIDGTQAAELILKDGDIPIVFLSSHTEPDIVAKTEKITSYGYVVKNSNIAVLDASIKMAFKLFEANRARYETARLMEKTSEHVPGAVYQYKMNSDGTACFPFSTHGIWDIYELTPEQLRVDVDMLSERTHPDDLKRVIASVQESYASLEPWECEFRVVLPERGERWIRGTANPEQAEDGVLWHGYFSDITERKQSEEELLHTNDELLKAKEKAQSIEEQTRFILKHNPNAIAVFDNDMKTVMVSDRYLEDYDLKDKDIIGKNHYEVFPEMPERWKEVHSRALRGETLSNDDDYFVRPDGSITYTRWECRPWYRSDNSIGGMIAYTEVTTERKQMERDLSKLVTRYDDLVALIPVGVYIVWIRAGGDKEFEYVSDQWCALHAVRKEEVMADSAVVDDLVHPDDRESFLESNREAANRAKPFEWEGRFFTGEGQLRWLRIESTPRVHENGDLRWFGVTQDITDRKAAEEKYQSLFNYSNDAILVHEIGADNLPSKNIEVNQQATELLGYTREQLLNIGPKDIVPEEHASAMYQHAQELMANNHLTFESENIRRDGVVVPVEVSAYLHTKGSKKVVVSSVRDITRRKRFEQELVDQKRYLEAILETTADGFWVVAPDERITQVNTAYCRMSGYNKDELKMMKVNHLDARENPDETAERIKGIMANGSQTFETKHRRKDGSVFDVEVSASRLNQADGVYLFAFCRDITDRKQAEEDLRTTSNLQSIILKMASDYINKSTEQVEETINDSLREIGEFVDADRAYVFEYDWVKDVASNTHEWCNEGVNPEIDNLQGVPNTAMEHLVEAHRKGEDISIEDVMQLPPGDELRQVLEPQGVRSILTLPMMRQDKCIGFVGFDSVRETREYSETEKTVLRVFSEFLVNIGHRENLEKNLIHAKEQAEELGADLTAIIEGATDGIWSFDGNYDIRYINDRFRNDFHAAFGVWLEQGGNLIEALPEALRQIWHPRYVRVLSNEQFTVTDEVETITGKQFIQVSLNPIVQGDRVIGGSCFGSDITDRKESELEIQKQLYEKETLLREVHHRVKNNMATIESFLSLQAGATEVPEVRTALQDTVARIQSTRVLYDKLLVSDDLNEVSIEPYANGLIDAIVMVFDPENNASIERHITDFGISPKKAFFLGIIINELLTNVFKYAFTDHDAGTVSVSIGKQDAEVTLIIHDNGVGFDERTLKNESPGFGLTVVQMLVEQSGGTFSQANDHGAKSVVWFEL